MVYPPALHNAFPALNTPNSANGIINKLGNHYVQDRGFSRMNIRNLCYNTFKTRVDLYLVFGPQISTKTKYVKSTRLKVKVSCLCET